MDAGDWAPGGGGGGWGTPGSLHRCLTAQVDGVEQHQAEVGRQAVQQPADLVPGVLSHPAVDVLQVGGRVVAQRLGAAAVQALRGVHEAVPDGQVCGQRRKAVRPGSFLDRPHAPGKPAQGAGFRRSSATGQT